MSDMAKRPGKIFLTLSLMLLLGACGSRGPATTYYVLHGDSGGNNKAENPALVSIGVGPVSLPVYLENSAIVSKGKNNILSVSGYHAWAEPLDVAISRVVARGMASQLNYDEVWAFPWDSRHRPKQQIHIKIEELDGVRGETLNVRAKWFVYDMTENRVSDTGSFSETVVLHSSSYSSYVSAIEVALGKMAEALAAQVSNN